MVEPNKNKIEEVKEALYSRSPNLVFTKTRHGLKFKTNETNTSWSDTDLENESEWQFPYMKIFLGAFIFFILAGGFAAYKFFAGSNVISGDNIDIIVRGPVSVAGGDELPLDIDIQNKNNVNLSAVDLKIEYPSGTRKPDNLSVAMERYSEAIGNINVGKSERRLIKAVLFGEENTNEDIKITVEYRVPGSNAIFYKEKVYTVLMSSAPVSFVVTGPEEINAKQKMEFKVEITSNSLTVIKNLILKADYPFGYTFDSASPNPSSVDKSVWTIGDLQPGAKRTIKILGIVQGQDGEQRVFKFTVGMADKLDEESVGTPFAVYSNTISIKKPFIGVDLAVDGDQSQEVSVSNGKTVRTDLTWNNNLASQIHDAIIQIKLRGGILDKSSIRVEKGFYNSIDNTIIFDKQSNSELASIDPGTQGSASFTFSSFSSKSTTGSSFNNPDIYMDISVTGKRIEGSNVPQELLYSDSKRIKIASSLNLISNGYRTVGPFENSGPVPPKAEQETMYTITWTATDILNDVNDAKVVATLPPYVKWQNLTSPSSENISFNSLNNEVTWNIGGIKSGTGYSLAARTVSFQVSITPSLSQVGTSPVLLGEASLSGIDAFTKTLLGEKKYPVTTDIKNDPEYSSDMGKVIQ